MAVGVGPVDWFVGLLIFTELLGVGDNDGCDLGAIVGTVLVLVAYRKSAGGRRTLSTAERAIAPRRGLHQFGVAGIGTAEVPAVRITTKNGGSFMEALTHHGKRDVRIDEVPDPTIQEPTDAIIKITSSRLCGSDLHLYQVTGTSDGAIHGRG